jgi:hypothetical protein
LVTVGPAPTRQAPNRAEPWIGSPGLRLFRTKRSAPPKANGEARKPMTVDSPARDCSPFRLTRSSSIVMVALLSPLAELHQLRHPIVWPEVDRRLPG